ncbi:DNA mismatch repair protein MutS [bacterium]|nr:DNA mismatch repair protein MutS [bacterium]
MRQYLAIKAKHPDSILFFRMGDFYEMFNEDAKKGARVLGITLTSRGHGKTGDVPLAGFPYHALDAYLTKMVKAGLSVAICEQVEDPKLAKGIVKRDVVQIVTPGTVLEEGLLDTKRNNYLAAVFIDEGVCGVASADVSTGEFSVTEVDRDRLIEILSSIDATEILVPESQHVELETIVLRLAGTPVITRREDWLFGRDYVYDRLVRHFKTATLKGFGCEDLGVGLSAAGVVLEYLEETQKTDLSHIRTLSRYADDDFMHLDAATRRNLELVRSMSGQDKTATLLSILDRTKTAMGGRMIASWLARPLNRLGLILHRLNAVTELVESVDIRRQLFNELAGVADMERLITRVVTRRANPRDLRALCRSLVKVPLLHQRLESVVADGLRDIYEKLDDCPEVIDRLSNALTDEPPMNLSDGGVIREGYNTQLDDYRTLALSGKDWIARCQIEEREKTGISSLKIGYNRVFGYYIEVTKTHQDKVPEHYIRKQTLVNAERFITPELKAMEEKVLKAEEEMVGLERELFEELRHFVAGSAAAIQTNGRQIAILDSLISLADAAEEYRYVRPVMHDGDDTMIVNGRHPVVERLLPPGDPFIPNDVTFNADSHQLLIITGPNMAGKSTYIRQVGLIVLMAQIGGFVPADSARIAVVDRIFTRVGAQDNLAAGESTFLVEMNETANILNNATAKSLVLLDEIGRGTSTFDGLSIAWAIAEFIHDDEKVRPKTLFATHYHELTELEMIMPRVKNFNVAVREWGENIVFLRKIVPGGCDHSYGIQVARLAGLPNAVIERARQVLNNLEANELTPNSLPKLAIGSSHLKVAEPQMSLFAVQETRLRDRLKDLPVDSMTPLEALNLINELQKLIVD